MDEDEFTGNSNASRRLDFGKEDNLQKDNEEIEKDSVDLEKTTNVIGGHHHIVPEDKIPKMGMEFESDDAAYEFYNEYALISGFSIRKKTIHKDIKGNVVDRVFCCSCEGERGPDKRDIIVKSHRPETRTYCKAKMKISARHSSKYKVVAFTAEHDGHTLVTPKKSHMLRSQRKITRGQAAQLDSIEKSGIPPKAGLDYMAQQAGGRQNVGFLIEDLRNYLRSKRTMQMKEGDARGLFHCLELKQSEDTNFFYAVQVDCDDLIANIFWADGQMKADYGYFGDVVSFDTTYRKNKEGRPFAIFVGVNHHKQTTIFGAALLYDETSETFMWLFDTFIKAMGGKKPTTILTDQDAAMAKALEEKWPETCHRLCIWHIYQNAAVHLSSVFSKFSAFSKDFSSCIYNYEEEDDFIRAWQELLNKYGLRDNKWLQRMFRKREKWALVYGRQTFCADMISTQRSESMHSALKRYVSYKHNLVQFFEHFGELIANRRYEERKADLRTIQGTQVLSLDIEILKHARTVYTHEVFKLFQEEVSTGYDSNVEIVYESEGSSQYKITPLRKRFQHTVTFDALEGKVFCSCKKFEFAGILCSHVSKVLSIKEITVIPEMYIKKRWTKRAKMGITESSSESQTTLSELPKNSKKENEKIRIENHYRELCRLHNQLSTRASLTDVTFEFVRNMLVKTIGDVDTMMENKTCVDPTVEPSHSAGYALEKSKNSCVEVMVRGWKKKESSKVKSGKRLKSGLEQPTGKRKLKHKKISSNDLSPDSMIENDGQNFNAIIGNSSATLQTASNPFLPSLSQTPQNYATDVAYWTSTNAHLSIHPTARGNILPYMRPSQTIELGTPNLHHQLNYWPSNVEKDQVNNRTSLTQLLQNQMLQVQDAGVFSLKHSSGETHPQDSSKEDGNA